MKQINFFKAFVLLATLILTTSCTSSSLKFKGTWHFSYFETEGPDAGLGSEYTLWLDPDEKTVGQGCYNNVIGVIKSRQLDNIYDGTTFAEITEFTLEGDSAQIKYRHKETGEIWKATLTLNTDGNVIRWIGGEMYKSGPNSPKELIASDAENPLYFEPSDAELTKISDSPNFKEIKGESIVCELPDRIFYREEVSDYDDKEQEWIIHNQLRCQITAQGLDKSVYETTYSWGGIDLSSISDVWAYPDNKGMLFVVWEGGTEFQTFQLYRTDGISNAELLDTVDGPRDNPERDLSNDDIPSVTKVGNTIEVHDPNTNQTRKYDLRGDKL